MPPRKVDIGRSSTRAGAPGVSWALALAMVLPGTFACAGFGSPPAMVAKAVSVAVGSAPLTRVHVVEAGDTVWAIAGGRHECVAAILDASQVADAKRIQPGQRLKIPLDGCPLTFAEASAESPRSSSRSVARAAPRAARPPAERGVLPPVAAGPDPEGPIAEAEPDPELPVVEAEPEVAASATELAVAEAGPGTDGAIVDAEAHLRAARFEEALAEAEDVIRRLGPESDEHVHDLARAHLVAANVYVALADRPAARRSLARALDLDPSLRLDPARTSPKVIDVLARERADREVRIARRDGAR